MSALSLISLNIERDKHLDLVLPFLKGRQPDVCCIQELFEKDVPAIAEALAAEAVFLPSTLHPTPQGPAALGCGIFSRVPVLRTGSVWYGGNDGPLLEHRDELSVDEKYLVQRYELAYADVEKGGVLFRIATTHFVWTPDGEADKKQRMALERMLTEARGLGEMALCGDFNAPRGKEIFARIASQMKDTIPAQYETSIDGAIHRAGPLPLMVDGLFTTPGYTASEVSLVSGVSDHCAITAAIERTS